MEAGTRVRLDIPDQEDRYGTVIGEYNVVDRMRDPLRSTPGVILRDERSSWQCEYIKIGSDIIKLDWR
jgi:hypothetical protein